MCGIVGVIGKGLDRSEKIDLMFKSQSHRGPDHTGKYVSDLIALGHNRLSIIDLSDAANQPFSSPDGRYIMVFNGEIYNYKELRNELKVSYHFQTDSDTEVLLAAYINYGAECLQRLNGMFSFAVWDSRKRELFAARDRFGVKPFYYTQVNNTVYFASEIKSLFAAGVEKEPNYSVWSGYFNSGDYGAPHETFWNNISQLPGGHSMSIDDSGKMIISKWYDFEKRVFQKEFDLSFNEALEYYDYLLKDSIKLRFRADVPVGFNLSGGLDSSALLSMVNTLEDGSNVNAFTFYTGDNRYDELPWVEELIKSTGNPLHRILLSSSEIPDLSKQMTAMQDEPYGGIPTIAYGKLFKEARSMGVKVLLDGQGMDEQWAGYDYYNRKESTSVIQGVKTSPFRTSVLEDDFNSLSRKRNYPQPFDDRVLNLQYRDLFFTKIPRALRFNDRVSMASSTELREPFLDYRMVEFAFSQPIDYKIKDGSQKYLVRRLMKSYMSDSISLAPKRPLQTPQREWLGDDLRDWVTSSVQQFSHLDFVKRSEIEKELQNYMNGDRDSSFHIWQWINAGQILNS